MTQQPHRLRRRLAGAAAIVLAAGLSLAGCASSSGGADGGTVTLKVTMQTESGKTKPWTATINAFQKANPNIKVQVTSIGNDQLPQVVKTQLQGGNGPDVFYGSPGSGNANSLLPLAKAGYLLDLSSYSWATGSVPSTSHDLYYQDDKLWAVPLDLVPVTWNFNETQLKKEGLTVPTTYADVLTTCKAAAAKGTPLIQLAGAVQANAGILALEIAASQVYFQNQNWDSDRLADKTTFAGTEGWKKTLQYVDQMNKAGCFQKGASGGTFNDLFTSVASGKSLSMFGPGSVLGDLRSLDSSATMTPYVFPGDDQDSTLVFASESNAWGINAKTKVKDAALKFVKYWTETSTQDSFAKAEGNVSLSTVLKGTSDTDGYENVAPLLANKAQNSPLANLFWPNGNVYTDLGNGVQGILTGQATVDQVLKQMDSDWS